jgi:signal transduction histidine kinase
VFDSMRIHSKLAMALAIPLMALIAISGFVVVLSTDAADEAEAKAQDIRGQVEMATSAVGPTGVLSAIQTERNGEAVQLLGIDLAAVPGITDAGAVPGQTSLRAPTDKSIAEFKAAIAGSSQAVRDIFAPSVKVLDDISRIRADIDASTEPKGFGNPTSPKVYEDYTKIVNVLFDSTAQVALSVDDARLRTGTDLIDLASRNKENGTEQTRLTLFAVAGMTEQQRAALAAAQARVDQFERQMARKAAGTPYAKIFADGYAEPKWVAYRDALRRAANEQPVELSELLGDSSVAAWSAWTQLHVALGRQLTNDAEALRAESDADAADARQRQKDVLTLAGCVVVAAGLITLLASRSISTPLHRLATEAEDVARHRLPEGVDTILATAPGEEIVMPDLRQVPERGGAEIAEVARSLNSVQTSAAELALEQAALRRRVGESFVNLGERNYELLTRQIDAITLMEQTEADPDILEQLFALDHLATRMRRNAESLLLLGGHEARRQWKAPVPLIDAIRGALGEVEDYTRVDPRRLDAELIDGSSVAALSHLLAELLENGLNFSPPDRKVEVIGRRTGDRYLLAIVDHGLGMTDEELDQANRRIAGLESYTVAPSRYLGHYVVGVQAKRLGVTVHLQNSPTGGVTARLDITAVLAGEGMATGPAPGATLVGADAGTRPGAVLDMSGGTIDGWRA